MAVVGIISSYIPIGRKNRPGTTHAKNYITIHNTGNQDKGANASRHAAYLQNDTACNLPVSWHYTVDDKFIYQHLPDNETAYHAGNYKGNNESIGIEICMNADGDLKKATDQATDLATHLMAHHNIPLENVVQHNYWTGKNCPELLRRGIPYTWERFIEIIKEKAITQPTVSDKNPSPWAIKAWDWAIKNKICDGQRPRDNTTREELITILYRYHNLKTCL